jgi:hypothetical protein
MNHTEHQYRHLRRVLDLAYDQSATGKGRERHANDQNFEDQQIMTITRNVGVGFPLGQAEKKLVESIGMYERGHNAAARAELLGAIVYTAAAWLWYEEQEAKQQSCQLDLFEQSQKAQIK